MIFFELLGIGIAIFATEIFASMLALFMADEDEGEAMVTVIILNSTILTIIVRFIIL